MVWSILLQVIYVLSVPTSNTNTLDPTICSVTYGNIIQSGIEMTLHCVMFSTSAWKEEIEADEDECVYDNFSSSVLSQRGLPLFASAALPTKYNPSPQPSGLCKKSEWELTILP